MNRDSIDFGKDKVSVLFRRMFIPTLLGMLSVSAMIAIDGIFVGHAVGSIGIGGINICVPLSMIFTGFGLMIGVGSSVVASVHLSKDNEKAARINVTQAVVFASVVTAVISVLILTFPGFTAKALGASETLEPYVVDYLIGWIPGCLLQLIGMIGLFVIRLDGAPKLAMWCNVIGSIANIVLDWLFLYPLGMGVFGAAVASSISVGIGGVIVLIYMSRYAKRLRFKSIKLSWKSMSLTMRNIGYQAKIGSSALLGELTMAVLMYTGNLVFMHYLGDNGVGAFGIACYYLPFVFMVGGAIAQSAQPIISYNMTKSPDRSIGVQRIAICTAVAAGLIVTSAFVIFPDALVSLFLSPEDSTAVIASGGLPCFAIGYTFFILNLTAIGYYQSVERISIATVYALLRGAVLLIPSFLLLPKLCGTPGIWLAMPVSESLTFAIILARYFITGPTLTAHVAK